MTLAPSLLGLGDELVARDVAAEVVHLVAVGPQERHDDGLADVVHVALNGADDDGTLGFGLALRESGVADLGGAGHGVGRKDELGQEHLAALEQIAHRRDTAG